MNPTIEKIADAVLYEGYNLYPYRPSSLKNRRRFTFGRVYPYEYSRAQGGAEPWVMQTQVLVKGRAPAVTVTIRFLHPVARQIGKFPSPLQSWPVDAEPDYEVVPELRASGKIHSTWQEADKQEFMLGPFSAAEIAAEEQLIPFSFDASRRLDPLQEEGGDIAGVLVRERCAITGRVAIRGERLPGDLLRMTVRIMNEAPVPEERLDDREDIVMRTCASTHTILEATDGSFVSLMDPPDQFAEEAEACENAGTWPVLVGEEGDHSAMLSSPIILYDYPQIAPESPGNFYDGTEIDEMLALRIKTMTEDEQEEMHHADEHTRQLLHRTRELSDDRLADLHGALRDIGPLEGESTEMNQKESSTDAAGHPQAAGEASAQSGDDPAGMKPESVTIDGKTYKPGVRVRIQPQNQSDVMDIALAGKIAIIQSVEQDFEDNIHLAVVIEDDPGRDLGMMRQPGHRFFYSLDDVELLSDEG